MKRYSLYHIVSGIFLIFLLAASVLTYFSITLHRRDLFQAAASEKVRLAQTIRETITSPSWSYRMALFPDLESILISGLARLKDIRFIRIINRNGEILQSNLKKEIGSQIKDQTVLSLEQSEKIRDDVFLEEKIKTVIYPGYENQIIWIGFSLESTKNLVQKVFWRYLFATAVTLLFIVIVIIVILRGIVDPLKEITTICESIRKGDLNVQMRVGSRNEIGELAETFNKMITDLKKSKDSLEEIRSILEIRVAARTRELKELAERLENEVKERTKDLQEKMTELERFNRLAVGREIKMIELKKEIRRLKTSLVEKDLQHPAA